ncbi:MAG: outer membrane lipoprotein-sorting protein [Verrucomicrobiales bacterium]
MKVLTTGLFLLSCAMLEGQGGNPDATELVREVRFGRAAQSYELSGELTKWGRSVPFLMSLVAEHKLLKFKFAKPTQVISLALKDNRYELKEQVVGGGEAKALGQERYSESIRGTDVTYEDLSQRFLYWPNPKILGDEKLRTTVLRDTWVIQLENPRRDLGPYGAVKIWVDKESRALLQIEAFDRQRRFVKRFKVIVVQKDRDLGIWLLEKMRIEVIDPKTNRRTWTYMKLSKPKRIK